MLDAQLAGQLRTHLTHLRQPVELVASIDDGGTSTGLRELLHAIADLSPLVSVREDGNDTRRPSFGVARAGEAARVRFAGIPLGHEFTSLVLALLQVGGHPPKVDPALLSQAAALDPGRPLRFETYVSLSCHNCPDLVQALNVMAVVNPRIECVTIDGALFPEEIETRKVMAVPAVFLDGQVFGHGRMTLGEILAKLDAGAASRAAAALDARAPYDVLVVGGGPAGASAAIYAARKGIRTALVAERFGGQVMDTMGIENLVSVPHTEGPTLVAAMERHVRQYNVDVINTQRAVALEPAGEDGFACVRLASGTTLRARAVVLAPGARWREMNVPGEQDYRTRGVCFCPHCDGPLFRGKRVAVIGGGNSGVEAAIDLAGMASRVTLLEFDAALRADAVLQAKLNSLSNVTVLTSARTTEVTGNGEKLTGLIYEDRVRGTLHRLELDGVFVQIGLLPNTEWLKGTVAMSARGEIEVDARGQTSVPGIFAGGDATTVPYKQIVTAMGEGSKASLGAFDYLIRNSPAAQPAAKVPVAA